MEWLQNPNYPDNDPDRNHDHNAHNGLHDPHDPYNENTKKAVDDLNILEFPNDPNDPHGLPDIKNPNLDKIADKTMKKVNKSELPVVYSTDFMQFYNF